MGEGLHFLEIELTSLCNFHCAHCYAVADEPEHMPYPLVETILSQAQLMGVEVIIFTGGEPLLYPQITNVLEKAKTMKAEVRLQTNSSLIDTIPRDLFGGLSLVQIGYDLPPAQGGIRSDTDIKEKVDVLRQCNVDIVLFVTLHKKNIHAVDYFVSLTDSLPVRIAFNTFSPVGRGETHQNLQLSPEEFKTVSKTLWDYYKAGKISRPSDPLCFFFRDDLKKKAVEHPRKILGGCMAGITSLSVTPAGEVLPCPLLRVPAGSLHSAPLQHIWRHSDVLGVLRARSFEGHCKTCVYVNACGGCRTRAYKTSSITGEDPLCFLHT